MSRDRLDPLASASDTVYQTIVDQTPKLKRGRVWCRACGTSLGVDPVAALKRGWPLCCGQSMTLDSPAERAGQGGAV